MPEETDPGWRVKVVKFGNLLIILAIFVVYVLLDVLTCAYFIEFDYNAQVAKRWVHMCWLTFLVILTFEIDFLFKQMVTFHDLPGRMRVYGTIYLLIATSFFADPLLGAMLRDEVNMDHLRTAYKPYFDINALAKSYVAVGVIVSVACIVQLILGFLLVGKQYKLVKDK